MLRTPLLAVHWEAHDDPPLPALLGRGALISEGPGKSIKLSLEAVLARPPVTLGEVARHEGLLAPAAHKDAGKGVREAPLLVDGLIGGVPPPLPPFRGWMRARSARYGMRNVLTCR